MPHETPTVRLAAFYLFYFTAMGVVVPYWSPYLRSQGFGPEAIGQLMAVFMAARIAAPMFMGAAADATGRPMRLVRFSAVLSLVSFLPVFFGEGYLLLAVAMGAFGFFYASGLPAFEVVTLNHLGERSERYGNIRLWGSLGFILAVVGVGRLLDLTSMDWVPWSLGACFLGIAFVGFTVPASPSPASPLGGEESAPFLQLLKDRRVLALLLVGVLNQAGHGPYYVFFSIRLEDVGYAKSVIGPLWALGVVAEIVIFLFTSRLIPRYGPRKLLMVALGMAALRWNLIARFVETPVILAGAQTLHAASYGVVHAVTIHLIHKLFVGRNQSRGQALYASFGFGVGGVVGSLFAGYSWIRLGPVWTYHVASSLPLLALVVAFVWIRDPGRRAGSSLRDGETRGA